uniref:Uncharacterized protein n=1 Tax=Fagus sylvatica TaxID=28930 RepID=A0A2N9F5Y9_FAGSY
MITHLMVRDTKVGMVMVGDMVEHKDGHGQVPQGPGHHGGPGHEGGHHGHGEGHPGGHGQGPQGPSHHGGPSHEGGHRGEWSMVMVGMVVEEDMDMNNMVMVVDITHVRETIFQFLPS